MGQQYGNRGNIVPVRIKKFNIGDEKCFEAQFVKLRYEIKTKFKLDREVFSYIEALDETGNVRLSAIYVDYKGHSVSIHLYSDGYFNKRTARAILSYPFNYLNVTNLFAYIKGDDEFMKSAVQRVGYKLHAVIADVFGEGRGNEQLIFCAKASDVARWLK